LLTFENGIVGLLPKLGFWHLGELYKPGAKVMREHFIFIENTFYVQRTRDMICGVHAGSTDSKDRACSGHIISIKDTFYVQRNAKKKKERAPTISYPCLETLKSQSQF
jgi:hypothetical protein